MAIYIYGLKCPIANQIRYIGKSNNPQKRLHEHIYEASQDRWDNKHKHNWIKKLQGLGLQPEVEVIEVCTLENWKDREIYWISQLPNLLNKDKGGIEPPSPTGRAASEETKNKLSKAKKGKPLWSNKIHPMSGKTHPRKGKPNPISKEGRANISMAMKQNNPSKRMNDDWRKNIAASQEKKVYMIDDQGQVLKEFSSVKNAAKELGLDSGAVSRVCRKEYSQTKGYMFTY